MGHWHDFIERIPGIEFTFTSPAQQTIVVPRQVKYDAVFIKELLHMVITLTCRVFPFPNNNFLSFAFVLRTNLDLVAVSQHEA